VMVRQLATGTSISTQTVGSQIVFTARHV
jgi:hypothetical protein